VLSRTTVSIYYNLHEWSLILIPTARTRGDPFCSLTSTLFYRRVGSSITWIALPSIGMYSWIDFGSKEPLLPRLKEKVIRLRRDRLNKVQEFGHFSAMHRSTLLQLLRFL
jgi:hypothetical protein